MTKLRKSVVKSIYQALSFGPYNKTDFNVVISPKAHGVLVAIKFIPYPNYQLSIEEHTVRNIFEPLTTMTTRVDPKELITRESPGDYKSQQIYSFDSIEKCIDRIHAWCSNIEAELSSHANADQINNEENDEDQEFLDHLDRWSNDNKADAESKFTEEEIIELRHKLESMTQQLKALHESAKITEAELERLNNEIKKLSADLPKYTKGVWFKLAANRLYKNIKRIVTSKEAKELAMAATKKFLGLP